jgi:AhpD family alkylhydroperoxidase
MSKDFAQIANDVMTGVGAIRQGAPDAMKAFAALSTAATATNTIDTKTKELMALAIGIAVHCDGCVAYHTKMAISTGRPVRRLPRPLLLPSTWEADRRRCMEAMHCAHTISLPAQNRNT